MIELLDYQIEAVKRMKNGCILCGGVGSGKSLTAIAYYYLQGGGKLSSLTGGNFVPMVFPFKNLYIITTARKRDTLEWKGELSPFLLSDDPEINYYKNHKIVIDSWNNIKKYVDIKDSFFIFDEQRVIGRGVWVKSFLKITKNNEWILLSATPGDTWSDYIPVFIANGFYKNRTEFNEKHVIFNRFTKYPKVERYYNERYLRYYRDQILINMDYVKKTKSHTIDILVEYDSVLYKIAYKHRWNPYSNKPIINAGALCYILRRIVNSDLDRQETTVRLVRKHSKVIIFYNFDYELEILRNLKYFTDEKYKIAEWNGHKHELIPEGDRWIYLVQYTAGAEGWNCIETDTVIFYSQNYSYRIMKQAAGRIDRLNTPFENLYYYHLKSKSGIDIAITRALKNKKNFNESSFIKW